MSSPRAVLLRFSGQVQGVGFRYSTCRVAEQFKVCGYVKNLSDGRVELLVEGEPEEVEAFLLTHARKMQSYIRDSSKEDVAPSKRKEFLIER